MIGPDRTAFSDDPIGYSNLAWHKWEIAKLMAGTILEPREGPSAEDLKSPILWLSHAHALSEAARVLIQTTPTWESMPPLTRGMCDCQYCAVALMLVGYSLETCLKAMHILRHGVDDYIENERRFHHHRLEKLADFLPGLSEKDRAILKSLTHFIVWAGRYPDPGSARPGHVTEVFTLSEQYKIAGRDLFDLVARVIRHVHDLTKA